MTPLQRLRHHVSGAIERGEKTAIVEVPAEPVQRFPIGTQFYTRGKAPQLCTVTDVLRTYNSAGVLVALRYVATHQFCGQTLTDRDVVDTTIARGLESAS